MSRNNTINISQEISCTFFIWKAGDGVLVAAFLTWAMSTTLFVLFKASFATKRPTARDLLGILDYKGTDGTN